MVLRTASWSWWAVALALLGAPALAAEPARWSTRSGVNSTGTTVVKTGPLGWNSFGVTSQVLGSGDGYVDFGAPETTSLKIVGLARSVITGDPAEVDFGFRLNLAGTFDVVEKGASVYAGGSFASGDRFKIEIVGSAVRYLRNGVLAYSSTLPPRSRLQVAYLASTPGAWIDSPQIGGAFEEGVSWTGHVNAASSGNTLWKAKPTLMFDAGAISTTAIGAGDGYVEVQASGLGDRLFGLSAGNTDTSSQDIDFAIELWGPSIFIIEGGINRGAFGSWAEGDLLRVAVEGGSVKYRKNGTLLFTSSLSPSYPLLVDTALAGSGSHLDRATISGALVPASVSAPTFSLASGTYASAQSAIVTGDGGSTIRGTTTGADPTETDPIIVSGDTVPVSGDMTLSAKAFAAGLYPSGTTTAMYRIGTAVAEPVAWMAMVNAAPSGSALWKSSPTFSYDSGAVSTKAINSADGYVEATASVPSQVVFGLSNGNTDVSYQDIDFAFQVWDSTLYIFEAGISRGAFGTIASGDVLRVAVEAGVVRYRKNGALLFTSSVAPSYPLLVDAALPGPSVHIDGAVLSGILVSSAPAAPVFSPSAGTYNSGQSVTITSLAGATIRYTLDGSDPTPSSPAYSSALLVATSVTIKAQAWAADSLPSAIGTATYTISLPTVETPTFAPGAGAYSVDQAVAIATGTPGAAIRYTTNGSDPTSSSALYTAPVSITQTTTLKAKAFLTDWSDSATGTSVYTLTATAPTISPNGATFLGSQSVTMSTPTAGGEIRYTTDGSTPAATSTLYTTAISVTTATTIKAATFKTGWTASAVTTATFTPTVSTPTFSPIEGSYASSQTVAISTATAGATIRYTLDGSDPTAASALYSAPVSITQSTTLKAKAFLTNWADSATGTSVYTLTATAPTISPNGATFLGSQSVTMSMATAGGEIRYTTDGSAPTATSTLYTAAISVTTPTTIKAATFKTGWTASGVTTATFTPTVATPAFSPVEGTYSSSQTVTISTATAGAAIRYTLDGSDPTAASTLYSAPVSITQTTTLKAKAFLANWADSATGTAVYTLAAAAPTISPNGATFVGSQSVTMSTATAGGEIRYTTDGSAPIATSTLYTASISVTTPTTIKAAAFKSGWSASGVTSATFTPTVATPAFSPLEGTYASNQTVAISTGTAGATIRYTLDGSDPTSASALYSAPVSITQSTTLKAKAFLANWADSATGTAVYTLTATAPTISPNGATFLGSQSVTMSTPTAGGEIRYTTDGSAPAATSTLYTTAISVTTATTIKAATFKPGWTASGATTATFTPTVATPAFSPVEGTYSSSQTVTISTATAGAAIRYTLDGSDPTAASALYSTPVSITQTTTLKAKAFLANWADSATGTAIYTLAAVPPTISPNGATFVGSQSVTMSTATAGAEIRYTTDGSAPIATSTLYTAAISVSTPTTIKAATFKTGWTGSSVTTATFTPTVATPAFSPVEGTYTSSQAVTISTGTAGATIRYTLDGSDPTVASTLYSAPVAITQTTTLKAKAFLTNWADSATGTAVYTLAAIAPTISPNGSTFVGSQSVSMSTATAGAEIRYTTDGSAPIATSTLYTAAISVATPTTIKAATFKSGWSASGATTATFTPTVAAPTFSPVEGSYTSNQAVAISTATAGATIRYTLDGSDPTAASTLYSAPVSIAQSTTLKAKAFLANWADSATGAAAYTLVAASPTISPNGATFVGSQSVTMSTATSGAEIRYTTDGSAPIATSTLYTTAISVTTPTTVKAATFKAGWTTSSPTIATFTPVADAPTIFPNGGSHESGVLITLSSLQPGGEVRYSIDGGEPTILYQGPFSLQVGGSVRARSSLAGWADSAIAQAVFDLYVAPPAMVVDTVAGEARVTMSTTTPAAEIRYTTDGSAPTELATLYQGPVLVPSGTAVAAAAYVPGVPASAASSTTATAQQSMAIPQPAHRPGGVTGTFQVSGFEAVNLYNGNVMFDLPLRRVEGRGGSGHTINLTIQRRFPIDTVLDENADLSFDYLRLDHLGSLPLGEPLQAHSGITNAPVGIARADGGSIFFVSYSDLAGDRCYCRPEHGGPSSLVLVGKCNSQVMGGLPTGELLEADGTRYRIVAGRVENIVDRNGNKTSFTRGSSASGPTLTIVDSLNRATVITYKADRDEIAYSGFQGEPRVISVVRAPLSQALDDGEGPIKTFVDLFPASVGMRWRPPSAYPDPTDLNNPYRFFDPEVISRVDIPGERSYSMRYNEYGELTRVTLPTHGAITYAWDWGLALWPKTYRRVVRRQTFAGATLATDTAYSLYSHSTGLSVTHFDGTTERHYVGDASLPTNCIEGCLSGDPFDGKEWRTEWLDAAAALVRRLDKEWDQVPDYGGVQLFGEVETLYAGATQISRREAFSYDSFGNRLTASSNDWGPAISTGSQPSPGDLLRSVVRTYQTADQAYAGVDRHLRALPLTETVYGVADGLPVAVSNTEWRYDEDSAPPLVPRQATGYEAPIGSNSGKRGNVTRTIRHLGSADTSGESLGASAGTIETTASYDVLGNVVSVTDARQNHATFDYADNFGAPDGSLDDGQVAGTFAFLTTATDAAGQQSRGQYDLSTGLPVDVSDANGVVTTAAYDDPLDRIKELISANLTNAASKTTFEYHDSLRTVVTRSDKDSFADQALRSETVFDELGRTIEQRQYEGAGYVSTETGYDLKGRVSSVSNPKRSTDSSDSLKTLTTYDVLDRPRVVSTPDNAQTTTTYTMNRTTVADPAGKSRSTISDGLGRIQSVVEATPTDATEPDYTTSYAYDASGNLVGSVQGVQVRTFSYDTLGHLRRAVSPEGGVTRYTYDANGNLETRTDANGSVTTVSYDDVNRPVEKHYSTVEGSGAAATPSVTYTYGSGDAVPFGIGRIVSTTNGIAKARVSAYDAAGRVISYRWTVGGREYPLTFAYSASGALSETEYPSGWVISNDFDSAGRVDGVSGTKGSETATFVQPGTTKYAPHGGFAEAVLGDGLKDTISYLPKRLQPEALEVGSSASRRLRLEYSYWHDGLEASNNGNVIEQRVFPGGSGVGARTQQFVYDDLNRLTGATETGGGWSQAFKYDRYGNRWTEADSLGLPGAKATAQSQVSAATNRLVLPGVAYDGAGNMTQDGNGRTLAYDAENRLVLVTGGNALPLSFWYDGEGRRVTKAVTDGTTNHFVYGPDGRLVGEVTVEPPSIREYVYAGTRLVAAVTSDGSAGIAPEVGFCGDDICSPFPTENCITCPQDCGCPEGKTCYQAETLLPTNHPLAFCMPNVCDPAQIAFTPGAMRVIAGQGVTFTANAATLALGATPKWFVNNVFQHEGTTYFHQFTTAGETIVIRMDAIEATCGQPASISVSFPVDMPTCDEYVKQSNPNAEGQCVPLDCPDCPRCADPWFTSNQGTWPCPGADPSGGPFCCAHFPISPPTQTCAEMGGELGVSAATCPTGFNRLGPSTDFASCCNLQSCTLAGGLCDPNGNGTCVPGGQILTADNCASCCFQPSNDCGSVAVRYGYNYGSCSVAEQVCPSNMEIVPDGLCGSQVCCGGPTPPGPPPCGDGFCVGSETYGTCPQDCPAHCGDGFCNGGETLSSCAGDCFAVGDGVCTAVFEGCASSSDCACADPDEPLCDASQGLGKCVAPPQTCVQLAAAANLPFKGCGGVNTGCDEYPGSVPVGSAPECAGTECCAGPAPSCGDGSCNGSETLAGCPGDCFVVGDGTCTQGFEGCASSADCACTDPNEPVCDTNQGLGECVAPPQTCVQLAASAGLPFKGCGGVNMGCDEYPGSQSVGTAPECAGTECCAGPAVPPDTASCGELGGTQCLSGSSCPPGYTNLGTTRRNGDIECLSCCAPPPPAVCGLNGCEAAAGETCSNCPEDCGTCAEDPWCGDGICNGDETPNSCPGDCGPAPVAPAEGACGLTMSCPATPPSGDRVSRMPLFARALRGLIADYSPGWSVRRLITTRTMTPQAFRWSSSGTVIAEGRVGAPTPVWLSPLRPLSGPNARTARVADVSRQTMQSEVGL